MKYAARTEVSSEKSRIEIEQILARYGAQKFMYGWQAGAAVIAFEANDRRIRFVLPLPLTIKTPTGRKPHNPHASLEQQKRQRWRALVLAIKAKLETVESGISTFENEFMAFIVLPNGMNVSEWLSPQIEKAYRDGEMPMLMLPEPTKDIERD